jgi:acetyl-CoA C-acetyltransferase
MPYSFSPVCVDTGCEDVQGLQVFRDDRLIALFVRLESDRHSDHQGCWFLEAGFGRCAAMSAGPFGRVEVRERGKVRSFEVDEHVRQDVSSESLASLKPIFKPEGGTVTAGNASGINDGGAAVILASERMAQARGLQPMGRVVALGHAGVAPEVMGLGPVEAVPIALARAGLSLADMDVIEANEAFAAQACAVSKLLGFDPEKVNPNGSGIGLGHPVGATGAMLTVKALYELTRTGGRYALVTMCIGGGQGIAMIIERLGPRLS